MFLTTQLIGNGRSEHWLWEYDESKPRMPEAADRRMHFAVKRLVGVYRTDAEARKAAP